MTADAAPAPTRHYPFGFGSGGARRALGEALAFAYATSGLLVMRWTGFDVPIGATLAVGGAATAALAVLPDERRLARWCTVAASMVLIGATGAVLAGAWIGVALVLADVIVRGSRAWPGLSGAHPTMLGPTTVLVGMAAWRADETTYRLGPTPFVLAAGITIVAVVCIRSSWRHYAAWAAATTAVYALAATRGHVYNLAGAVAPVLASAAALLWWSARRGPDGRFGPWRSLGPLVAAVPAILWWMVNVGLATIGEWTSGRHLYGAWDAFASTLPNRVTDLNAAAGIPSVLAGLLVGGAFCTVLGRPGARAIALGVVVASLASIAIASTWQVGYPR